MARPGVSHRERGRALGAIGAYRGSTGRRGGPLRSRWRGWWPVPRALSAAPALEAAATLARVLVVRPGVSHREWGRAFGATGAHRTARRPAEEPVAGLAAGTSSSERGTGLGGGGDGSQGTCNAARRVKLRR